MKVNGKFTDMLKYDMKAAHVLRSLFVLLALMIFGTTSAWGQTDYSGTYYIRSTGRNTSDANKFYLCPTEGWYFYESPNKYSEVDNGNPFLTTYKIFAHADYDISKAVWGIEKHPSEADCYYIKQLKTGRYMVSNGQISGSTNANRVRVHLEAVADAAALTALGDLALFEITAHDSHLDIVPHAAAGRNGDNKYLVVNNGNHDLLNAQNSKTDGAGGKYGKATGGIISLYTHEDNAQYLLEEAVMPPTITFDAATGTATITSVEGTTIRYALDAGTPAAGGTSYTSPTDPIAVAGHTAIKAMAVRTSDSKTSAVSTMSLKAYTYHIVSTAGIAITHTVTQPVGMALSSYTDIPAAIRSPYLEGETVRFFSNSACTDEYEITETQSATTNIYVTYTTTHLSDKFLQLSGARALNVTVNGNYLYDDGTNGSGVLKSTSSDADKATRPYLWFFEGGDPYALQIRNAQTNNLLSYVTPSTLSLAGANNKFIIMDGDPGGVGSSNGQMELMAATGGDTYYRVGRPSDLNISTTATGASSVQVRLYTNSSEKIYHLIDQSGHDIMQISSTSESLVLPSDYQSPLVETYNYWKVGAFDKYGDVFKLKDDPESYRVNTLLDVTDDNIYVTYVVNNTLTFNLTETSAGTAYMLNFPGGEEFYQENGADGVSTTKSKAVYPYANGDGLIYVYGTDQRTSQFNAGASTRPRWLWYPVSPADPQVEVSPDVFESVTPDYHGDPYNVKIMSHSGFLSTHCYFRTYAVTYDDLQTGETVTRIVTGATSTHERVDANNANLPPTRYMILKAPNNRYKLVTVDKIAVDLNGDDDTLDENEDERRTVTSFEQYWRNNPTVQHILAGSAVVREENYTDDIDLTSTQVSHLPQEWHTYKAFARSAPWVGWKDDNTGTSKQYLNKKHWFETIDMGSTGEFTFEATTLEPQVILLDQHGWEVMRAPLSAAATLRKYNSPMVETYHWYPTATKTSGYHKFTPDDPEITVYESRLNASGNTVWYDSGERYTHTSTSLDDSPYDHFTEHGWEEQGANVKTDFYVTYDVKPEYARLYAGAATEGGVQASAFLVKQGDNYAKINGTTLDVVTSVAEDFETMGTDLQWYVKPNFNIDAEMGYIYAGNPGAQDDAETKNDMEAAYYAAGKNGFDPYNVQIQSVANQYYYFKTLTTGSHLSNGGWAGSSTDLELKNMSAEQQTGIIGYDQSTLHVTNATFMVIDDGSGRLRLMPRFDHTMVVNSFDTDRLTSVASANTYLTLTLMPKVVHFSHELSVLGGNYILASDFIFEGDFESLGTAENPFTGSIDGGQHTFTDLSVPLLNYADGAIIKNLILDNVNITGATNAGAIAANATGDTRIYNCGILASNSIRDENGNVTSCSSTVSGTAKVGGIVGFLDGDARVVNCFSYANITGGTDVAGIVGYNNYASNAAHIRTMVMNCVFYGDITSGSTVSPVYGGLSIDNLNSGGLNTFNYYAYDELKTRPVSANKYHCALAIEEKNLKRFELYRLLLNSNKKLAAIYATSPNATVYPEDMMKWVLETADRQIANPNPYPVLKAQGYYPSIINYDAEHAPDSASVGRNHGGYLGRTLTVHLSGTGITTSTLYPKRTDKDFDRFNYNYDKIQLPYFNDVGTGNYEGGKVVTGWKITSMTGGTAGTYSAADAFGGYNFADRRCTNKDIYGVGGSNRVFSQGAYFDVPYGVTDIYIEPYWGDAAFVADQYYDVVYNTGYTRQNVTQLGTQVASTTTYNGQKVYTTIAAALANLKGATVYDNAIVLVGNLHQDNVPSNGDTPFTVMSVDADNDHEPDYSMIYHHTNRTKISPIRFDFINIPGKAQAQKPKDGSDVRNFTIFKTRGWFETTNTCLVYSNQVEYENQKDVSKLSNSPLILLGGDFEQFVSTQSDEVPGKTNYIHVGGNVHIQSFGLGTHGDGSKSTPHIPVSVTGGSFDNFYLTGTYNQDAEIRDDNAECYISGGYFKEAAGACQEQIGKSGGTSNGNVSWQIYNADIDAFYGGGINAARPVQGHVTTYIYNSHVTLFCGGPKFGDMQSGKQVTTNAVGCVFGKYFGGGYGGTSYSKKKYYDLSKNVNWGTWAGKYTADRGKYFDGKGTNSKEGGEGDAQYGKKGIGVATDFEYEFFVWSSGTTGGRLYVNFASFSLATCNDVESNLKGCTVEQDFYGGGSYGEVKGKATSVLDGCTVQGNVFGGGYSATLPTLKVRNGGFTRVPNFNKYSGMFEPGIISTSTTECEWKNASKVGVTLTNNTSGSHLEGETPYYICTDVDLDNLGKVGATDLTIKGNTSVVGSVFGGGDMSAVTPNLTYSDKTIQGDTKVTIEKNDNNETPTVTNVYGGGNTADVTGNTEVHVTYGTVSQDVFGGGKGQNTVVVGDVTVNIGTKSGAEAPYTYTGNGTVTRNVYGGSALGAVNASATKNAAGVVTAYTPTENKTTKVNVYAGTVNGSVFGGGLGYDDTEDDANDIIATNFGATTVLMENSTNDAAKVLTAVYGGSNENGVLKGTATVTINGGTIGTSGGELKNVVFGGGFGQPTMVEGNVTVNVGTEGLTSAGAIYHGNVYGGSALGGVNVSDTSGTPTADTKTTVNLLKGTINGNVFGGGLGRKAAAASGTPGDPGYVAAVTAVAATVGGDVFVTLDGAKLNCTYAGEGVDYKPVTGQIFGCNNLNGSPKGHVKVWVKRTVNVDPAKDALKSNDATPRDSRTTYDVAAVYGGGNEADYRPTDAELVLDEEDPEYETKLSKFKAARAEVIIDGCDDTSIEYVYGGGNAAAVPATEVTILGSYILDYVFGGGNGKGTGNPGANIGAYNNGATEYGTGKAVTQIVGGHIHYVFGGSNTKGNVLGGTSVTMPDAASYPAPTYDCCTVRDIKEIYGAGNEADQDGTVTLILGCVNNMDYVYGGARNANVNGGVDLIVTSGHFKGVFGGNDTAGSILGPITLTIEETGCDPLEIENLYLGGNLAAYSVYGYKEVDSKLVARTKTEYDALTNEQKTAEGLPYADPVLNIISCTSIGNGFGGGYGAGATLYGNPTVNVDMIPGKYAKDIDRDGNGSPDNDATLLGEVGNVYGGGSAADVVGDTHVNICTKETVTVRSDMGAAIPSPTPTAVEGAYITGNVFGAGLGLETVVNNTSVVMAGGTVAKSIYGGGELGSVNGDTDITVRGGTIGDSTGENAGETYGNVYGGGKGNTANVRAGLIKGNTNITIQNTVADAAYNVAHPETAVGTVLSSPSIYHNIYGGGAHGSVGNYTYASEAVDAAITGYTDGGIANITITGGTIGIDGHENGMVFGSSRGEVGAADAICDKLAWVYDTNVTIGTDGAATGPTVKGSVYGGGENGHTYRDASVTVNSGTIGDPTEHYAYRGNVYGAGCGTDKYNGNYNPKSGIVNRKATVLIKGGQVAHNVYGAGAMGSVLGTTDVTITGTAIIGDNLDNGADDGNVYGAARGDLSDAAKNGAPDYYSYVTTSTVTVSGGTVKNDVYGGGQAGHVKGAVSVNLNGGTVEHDVYGGGALAQTNTLYDGANETYKTYVTTVTLGGTTVNGNVYGGGLGQLAVAAQAAVLYADEAEYNAAKGTSLTAEQFAALSTAEKTKTPAIGAQAAVAANVNGPVTVSVTDGTAANVFGCNNINGAPQTTVSVEIGAKSGASAPYTYSGTGIISGSVYGGGNQAAYSGTPAVKIYKGTMTNVYGGGLGTTAVTGGSSVTMEGGLVNNDVYGGGSQADVTGNVAVTIAGGTVTNDVYGGGALANTNTANWNGDGSIDYEEVTGLVGTTYRVKEVLKDASVEGLYIYNSGTGLYESATGTADGVTTYYERLTGAPVAGYYTESAGIYTKLTSGTANGETTYYKKKVKGSFVATPPINGTDYYTTTVSLTGGLIGNAYGGGLGNSTTAANVYGDVTVSVNEGVSDPTKGVTFVQRIEHPTIGGVDYPTPTSGRVFGCNNHNGTPTGNVEVHVYSTRQIDADNNIIAGHGSSDRKYQYEIQSVYGGGNQADYMPASGKKSHVIIEGCSDTSIEKVYGGGNSAVVPETDVTIYGAYDIGYAFGGGNGDKPIKKADGTWHENEGAIVIGLASITCHGGKIGQVFGGGDSKGSCGNTNAVSSELPSSDPNFCPLRITRLYGAGNKGDVASVNIVLAACSGNPIDYVHGGSYNAHVTGDVHLTITSGILKNVYGGNDARGGIGGNIIVDIEETNGCNPIIIQNLVGGGNEAPYPGTHIVDDEEVAYTTRGKITVNVKSATRIDNIYGGSFMAEANADTEVNINMILGNKAGETVTIPKEFSYIPNISDITDNGNGTITCQIDDAIGTIGNVYGGGNQGLVKGNAVVNICSSDKVSIMERDGEGNIKVEGGGVIDAENGSNILGQTILYDDDNTVLGAHISGNVFGGGNESDVTGNATVNICTKDNGKGVYEKVAKGSDGVYVRGNVYGGGNLGTVGTYTAAVAGDVDEDDPNSFVVGEPKVRTAGGTTTVRMMDGEIGPAAMPTNFLTAYAGSDFVNDRFVGHIFGGGKGAVGADIELQKKAYVNTTDVTVAGTAFVKGSVYGGAENGRVLNDTYVKIQGGQIGCGAGQTAPFSWADEVPGNYTECPHWAYTSPHDPFDIFTNTTGTDGHTYYGNVFGGGSGYFPYAEGKWMRTAGLVRGKTKVEINGGHILTSVYGGNEQTDVTGDSCVVIMKGGTLGVPRTDDAAALHPVTCYLFGAGKGDQRTLFNTWTNVENTRVYVGGTARIFGSIFGGGEDGHVLQNAKVQIYNGTIGTTGTSSVEGNVFGGGRGLSGEALTAGSTGGNVDMTIAGGTIKGNVYGGGRLASVGIPFTSSTDPSYGQLLDDVPAESKTYGHITIAISGGTIGSTTVDSHSTQGNVFGGSMGRITLLDDSLNPLWPKLAVVKLTDVTISGGTIMNNVYGGSEYGIVRNQATVNMTGGNVRGNIFGGGYGSDRQDKTTITAGGYASIPTIHYTFMPMQWTGCVSGNTFVNISGGTVAKNVYGGGDMASVGLINYNSNEAGTVYNYITEHNDPADGFALSWPYEFEYIQAAPNDDPTIGGGKVNGKSTVNISGSATVTGIVFGAGKGKVWFGATESSPMELMSQRYTEAFMSNVLESEVTISGGTVRTVYGGGEDGHVYNNAKVTINGGTIQRTVFGGGKGTSTFVTTLWNPASPGNEKGSTENVHSWTAGKVFGNTEVIMNAGNVGWFIYGGGNMASVGKGNYSGGADDYTKDGYGETLTGSLWTHSDGFNPDAAITDLNKPTTMADHFLSSGKTTVTVLGGTVGTDLGLENGVPKGSIFGGSRGNTAMDVANLVPRYRYVPDFYLGYVNRATINIGGTTASGPVVGDGPTIKGCIYGGGQDGHVRNSTEVKIFKGSISGQTGEAADRSGNVFGAGSGIGTYTPDDGVHNYCNSASGSVTCTASVEVNGGSIAGSVYGGGALASVGPPNMGQEDKNGQAYYEHKTTATPYDETTPRAHGSKSYTKVDINAGSIGGSVYGASRGPGSVMFPTTFTGILTAEEDPTEHPEKYNPAAYATSIWTEVNVKGGTIAGNVYGGGEMGQVMESTEVYLAGGTITHDAYGGGQGTAGTYPIAADVGGNTTVELNKDAAQKTHAGTPTKGCIVDKIFGCNDLNGTPKGHVLVHVYATQNNSKDDVETKFDRRPVLGETGYTNETIVQYLKRLLDAADADGVSAKITASVVTDAETTYNAKKDLGSLSSSDSTAVNTAIANVQEELCKLYDVTAVYGGGDLAQYEPSGDDDYTEVIIDGCDYTSIRQVYGGGNAACVPATNVSVRECYVIDELFGGGNGLDEYEKDGKWYENPGANVGYHQLEHHVTDGTQGTGADAAHAYISVVNTSPDATTKAGRQNPANGYLYGSGVATTTVTGGHVNTVYGGSNQKGNIREVALSQYQKSGTCALVTGTTYGGSKNAEIDAEIRVVMDCVDKGGTYYGGSANSDINNNVTIDITNGTYTKVFGGNNLSGTINGAITINIEERGCTPIIIGELYGGGNQADYSVYGYNITKDGSGNVTSRTALKKDDAGALATPHRDPHINIISATKIDNIFGGAYKAKVIGSPTINVNMTNGIITENYADDDDFSPGPHTKDGATYNVISNSGIATLGIGTIGNIFGGGNEGDILGNTTIEIGTGQWYNQNGELETKGTDGVTYRYNTTSKKWEYLSEGHYVAVDEAPVPARKEAYITGSVYGGGKMGHVGDFTLTDGKPTSCEEGTGTCTVTISHGEIGPDDMQMTKAGGPDDSGHVFGAGQGTPDLTLVSGATEEAKVTAMNNMAYVKETQVLINGDAFIKGSVYGGSENGHVLGDTHVTIDGNCQIGNGDGVNRRYTDAEWEAGHLIAQNASENTLAATYNHSLPECASWAYESPYKPHDKFANATGDLDKYSDGTAAAGRRVASDGHTFYGNVFGGGSGYYPYAEGKWNMKAGWVEGNTLLEIKGGHILTSAYGGNEMTNVGSGMTADKGKSTVRMTGGTLGVPRTLAQIAAHPVTCYLFGAGKGDQNIHFNKDSNVKEVEMEVTGGKIYGSVFGGGEDGHVLGDVTLTIGNSDGTGPAIGTWGTSYVDGNVFGGGRGFTGEALTAGVVSGNVNLNIKGGTMLGSIYGGGRMASVGTYLADVSETSKYGKLIPDDKEQVIGGADVASAGRKHGLITVNVTGGTIGNNDEFIYVYRKVKADDSVIDNEAEATALTRTEFYDFASFKEKTADEAIPGAPAGSSTVITEEDYGADKTYKSASIRKLYHPKGGNIFAGCMGRLTLLNGNVNPVWAQLGQAKRTVLNVSGGTIKGSLFGGAEFGQVQDSTIVNLSGGTIGTEIKNDGGITQYTFGSVYGGGYGSLRALTDGEIAAGAADPREYAGLVSGKTIVEMSGGEVKSSVYGGGKMAQTGGNATVTVSGGRIGLNKVRKGDGYVMYGGQTMGNVYGSGRGDVTYAKAGCVKGNTTVNIKPSPSVAGEPFIGHNVYGGGALASVGTFGISNGTDNVSYVPAGVPFGWADNTGTATVSITGGTIGISGRDNGMVCGSSRGDLEQPSGDPLMDRYDRVAWVKNAVVNIGTDGSGTIFSTPLIRGSVYGGGENGHNSENATVNIYSGTIGITDSNHPWYDFHDEAINKKAQITRGNVYGAGCGTDTYTGDDGKEYYNPKSGMVGVTTRVNISGGHIAHNVYGGGSMGSVGTITDSIKHSNHTTSFAMSWPYQIDYASGTGTSYVTVTGGRIGMGETGVVGEDNGNVYGGTRGMAGSHYYEAHLANVNDTYVTINYPTTPTEDDGSTTHLIAGSVFGGSEDGHVMGDSHVSMLNGLVKHSLFAGGRGQGTYKAQLKKLTSVDLEDPDYTGIKDVRSITSGKVYGNTYLEMTGGHVWHNVFGGGYMASVGKGNYSGGADDYATGGYGETITGNLWSSAFNPAAPESESNKKDNAWYFLNSGKTYLTITGGKVGRLESTLWDGLPSGSVFGSSRGVSAPNITNMSKVSPQYCPEFFSGYVNETFMTIGGDYKCVKQILKGGEMFVPGRTISARQATALSFTESELSENFAPIAGDGPTIYGSVYGGGQDGHVRRESHMIINKGELGAAYTEANQTTLGTSDRDNPLWLLRGNLFGAGSGIGTYRFDLDGDGEITENKAVVIDGVTCKETGEYSTSAGSVTHFTVVDVYGGTIHRNVYGGGSLASVGPPPVGSVEITRKGNTPANYGTQSVNLVNIAGTIGTPTEYQKHYGGEVYGASRGLKSLDADLFGTCIWTRVNLLNGANVQGNVFGGGDAGKVKRDAEVNVGVSAAP